MNLPKADPLITMRFYKIRREGLSNLWIKHDESEGTTLKLMLNEGTSPDGRDQGRLRPHHGTQAGRSSSIFGLGVRSLSSD